MNTLEEVLEMCGMLRSKIVQYFADIGGEDLGSGRFRGVNWVVIIGKENMVALGALKIPEAIVTFRCSKDMMKKMIYSFRLRFLTAGG